MTGVLASRRGVEKSLEVLIVIVILLLLVWLVILPILKKSWSGMKSSYACTEPSECMVTCPSDYMHQMSGDIYCQEYFGTSGSSGGGGRCCEPLNPGSAGSILRSDIKIYQNTKQNLIPNKGTVTLGATSRLFGLKPNEDNIISSKFIVEIGKSAASKQCYWEVGRNIDGERASWIVHAPTEKGAIFQQLFSSLDAGIEYNGPKTDFLGQSQGALSDCTLFAGTSSLVFDLTTYMKYLGQTLQFTLVAIDKEQCIKDGTVADEADFLKNFNLCPSYSYTVYVRVPDRNPKITLTLDKKAVALSRTPTPVLPGSHTLELVVDEPLQECSIGLTVPLTTTAATPLSADITTYFERSKESKGTSIFNQPCFQTKQYKKSIAFTVPENVPGGIPFDLNVTTSFSGRESAKKPVAATYHFLLAPDNRFTVKGPSPGLEKEKQIDLACNGVSCTSFWVAFVDNPFDCKAGTTFNPLANLTVYSSQGSGRWRFTLRGEENNGRYLCVKAASNIGERYALGSWNGLATPKAIDATKPAIDVQYNPWIGSITMYCLDQPAGGEYTSGCQERPFSYAYITDPLMFVTQITTTGMFKESWNGCPDPDTGYWIKWNSDQPVMPYLGGQEVKVICVRATDNAGNSVTTTRLLYGGPEVLALFLQKYLG